MKQNWIQISSPCYQYGRARLVETWSYFFRSWIRDMSPWMIRFNFNLLETCDWEVGRLLFKHHNRIKLIHSPTGEKDAWRKIEAQTLLAITLLEGVDVVSSIRKRGNGLIFVQFFYWVQSVRLIRGWIFSSILMYGSYASHRHFNGEQIIMILELTESKKMKKKKEYGSYMIFK